MTTPQRLWQIKKKKEGKCIICGRPLATKNHCRQHARKACELVLKYYNEKRKKNERKKNPKGGRKDV